MASFQSTPGKPHHCHSANLSMTMREKQISSTLSDQEENPKAGGSAHLSFIPSDEHTWACSMCWTLAKVRGIQQQTKQTKKSLASSHSFGCRVEGLLWAKRQKIVTQKVVSTIKKKKKKRHVCRRTQVYTGCSGRAWEVDIWFKRHEGSADTDSGLLSFWGTCILKKI